MIIAFFFAYLILYNILDWLERLIFKQKYGALALLSLILTCALGYPKTAEISRIYKEGLHTGRQLSWRLMPHKANDWDWLLMGSFYAFGAYVFFVWLRLYSDRGYSSGGIARTATELDLSTIMQLCFWAAAAILITFAGYKLLSD